MEFMVMTFFTLITIAVGLLGTAFWIWMIIDCANNEPNEGNDKIVWILVIVLTGFIGAAIYYFARRPNRMRIVGK
ncbi:MAG: PLDc_N domain-containing protein [candidate division WOR-3 bacterium]|nr:MAG: PLDc_N domain-containing protein [candidate division WOR-3 bacterium]